MSFQFDFDPYSNITPPQVSRVVLFYCGRYLSRIYWHLQQGFLLGSRFDLASHAGRIRESKVEHLANGLRVADTLSTLVGLTGLPTADAASRDIRRSAVDWKSNLEPDLFRDAIDNAAEDLQRQPEEYSPSVLCAELIHDYVDPLYESLLQSITGVLPQQHRDIFKLGVQCERGLCRTDVCRLLTWSDTWPVLADGLSSSVPDASEILEEQEDGHVREVREVVPTYRCLATRSFAPGELAPEDSWFDDFHAAWQLAGLSDAELATKLEPLARQVNQRTLRRDGLRQAMDKIHHLACESILDRSPTTERVTVDLETSRITVDGIDHDVEPHHARIIAALREAATDGSWWVTDTDIEALPGCKGKNLPREFKILYRAVPSLEPLIVGKKGKGRRLK